MAAIPKVLQDHINTAFPNDVCLVGTARRTVSRRSRRGAARWCLTTATSHCGSRGKGSTADNLADGTKVTIYFRKAQLRADGILPKGGIARFYGTAKVHKSGPVYEEVWKRLIQPEKDRDPDKKGFAVLIEVERAEELDGTPLKPD